MIADETFPDLSCCEESLIQNASFSNSSGFSNLSNDEVFSNQTMPPKYMESLMLKPVLETESQLIPLNESHRRSQNSVRNLPPRAPPKKKRAQSCQNLKYSHVPSKVKIFYPKSFIKFRKIIKKLN